MATSNMEGAMKEAFNKTAQEMYPELNLSEDQDEAIGAVIRGSDTIVNLPVGSGKSLIFTCFQDFCRSVGGRLAVPKNEREHQFLRWMARHSGKEYIWIGVADFIAEGKWLTFPDMWHAKYVTWGDRQPDERTKGNCVDMIRAYDYRWNDAACDAVINFICEKAI